jgi:hypothetical protein
MWGFRGAGRIVARIIRAGLLAPSSRFGPDQNSGRSEDASGELVDRGGGVGWRFRGIVLQGAWPAKFS